jgi:hypothetical protein
MLDAPVLLVSCLSYDFYLNVFKPECDCFLEIVQVF